MSDHLAALRLAYLNCAYGPAAGRFRLHSRPDSPPAWATPGRRWAILTAWNPGSNRQVEAINHAAQARLEAQLRAAGWAFQPAWNGEGEWREESALVSDIPLAEAVSLGQRYGQHALLWGVGRRVALVWLLDRARRPKLGIERFWAVEAEH